jgi:hypothetical protein
MSTPETVWIVMVGEPYEGGSILGVFATEDVAHAFASKNDEERHEELLYMWTTVTKHTVITTP